MNRRDLTQAAAALPARALTEDENRALERAIGLSLTPRERLEWLDRTVAELTALRGLAAGRLPADSPREVVSAAGEASRGTDPGDEGTPPPRP